MLYIFIDILCQTELLQPGLYSRLTPAICRVFGRRDLQIALRISLLRRRFVGLSRICGMHDKPTKHVHRRLAVVHVGQNRGVIHGGQIWNWVISLW